MINENKEKSGTPENIGEGDQSKTNTLIDDTNLAAKRLEEATAAAKEERLAREEAYAKMKLGGETSAGEVPAKPRILSDVEYAEALERGEVNPLNEDGII